MFPTTSKPVPVKSKIAYLLFLSIVRAKVMGVPSSMYSVLVKVSTSFKLFSMENLHSKLRTDSAAF